MYKTASRISPSSPREDQLNDRYQDLKDIVMQRQKMREKKNLPSFMASTDRRLQNCTNRFFVERHAVGGSIHEELLAHLHKIEAFVDFIE